MINYCAQPRFTHLPNCNFLSLYFKWSSEQNLFSCKAGTGFLNHIPAKQAFGQSLPRMLLPQQPQIEPEMDILLENMGEAEV